MLEDAKAQHIGFCNALRTEAKAVCACRIDIPAPERLFCIFPTTTTDVYEAALRAVVDAVKANKTAVAQKKLVLRVRSTTSWELIMVGRDECLVEGQVILPHVGSTSPSYDPSSPTYSPTSPGYGADLSSTRSLSANTTGWKRVRETCRVMFHKRDCCISAHSKRQQKGQHATIVTQTAQTRMTSVKQRTL